MTFVLGVDLGTTFTAAAIADAEGVRMVGLTHEGFAIPSVLTRTSDGIAVGDAALSVAATKPWMVAREFKRRFGDETPFVIGDDHWRASELTGMLFDWVIERVVAIEGAAPTHVAITHPATWSVHRLDLLDQATNSLVGERTFIPEPTAAAIHYHERARIDVGSSIAIYDLGGGTFDATVLRRTNDGYEVLGRPSGIDQLGGLDLDQVVFDLVVETMPEQFADLDPDDVDTQRCVARLREECTRAKIGLSFDARVAVPVVVPGAATDVLVTRSDFEARIEQYIALSLATLAETIRAAALEPSDLASILLVGGSSRVPVIAERLYAAFGVDVVVDAHPKFAVAMGAVLSLSSQGRSSQNAPSQARVAVEAAGLPDPTVDISQLLESMASPRVVIVSGPSAGRTFALEEGKTTIGRSADKANIAVPDPVASRLHLEIERSGAELLVTDLGSTAGTRVDRSAISEAVPVRAGSLVEMGSTWLLIDDPLRRTATPGAVLLDQLGSSDPATAGKPARGWATLGFGGDPLAPVRVQLIGQSTQVAIPASLGGDLVRSMLVELLVVEPMLPIAVLSADATRWSIAGSEACLLSICATVDEIPGDVFDHGVLVIDQGFDSPTGRGSRQSGLVWLSEHSTEGHHIDQLIRLDSATAAVELLSGDVRTWVDVPATLASAAVAT